MNALTSLSAPDVIEALDYESILAQIKAAYLAANPAFTADVESDPVVKMMETCAYRELGVRQRVNDSARALLLAKASGTDLDHIAFTYYQGLTRLVVDPGNAAAIPPILPTYELDDRLRERCRLSLYAYSTAGPRGAYKFYAMTASAKVKDVHVAKHTPEPGDVMLTLISTIANGVSDQALLDVVMLALDTEEKLPMNDTPFVQTASIVNWTLAAGLICYPDANTSLVLQLANAAAVKFVADHHALGHDINISALAAILHVPGVQRVQITTPAADVIITDFEAPFNTAIAIAITGTAT